MVCNSKNWFALDEKNKGRFETKFVTKKEDLGVSFLREFDPEYIFFVHWNWKVEKEIYDNFKCVVFHTSPLPYGRGGSPIQNLILEGFEFAPVCALKMTDSLDAGPIYSKVDISLKGSLSKIFERINVAVNNLICELVDNDLVPHEQQGKPHIFNRLTERNNEIPKDLSIKQFYDRVRMLDHKDYPNAFICHGKIKIEFFGAEDREDSIYLKCKIFEC
tara:strand:- start:429 stop:1082 length:654 start_codon:yes stop_codon:yes gene_type:complete